MLGTAIPVQRRILIVRTDRVGDVVMMTPIVRELKKAYPDCFIGTLTQPNTANILLNNPYIDAIITDDLQKETFWSTVKKLRKHKFNYGLLLMPTERAAWQMFWAGIKTRVGVGHKLYEIITGMRSVDRHDYNPLKHEADFCMDTARKIGLKTNDITPNIFLTDQERIEGHQILAASGINNGDFKLMLHTGSLGSAPNWSEGKYLVLVERIINEINLPNLKIILTAREMSRDFINAAVEKGNGKVVDISEEMNKYFLRDFIKIISIADLFIGSSTGPIHLADALDIKCIGLHCHRPMNSAEYWGILNKKSINLEVSEFFCDSHCSKDKQVCCIEDGITTDDVINAINSLIN